jgi:hypothetical protein
MMRKSKPRTPLVVAAFSLSSMMFLCAAPASADCGGGALSTSGGNLLGSAIGGAAGGLLGNQMGRGTGKGVMTGVGVVGGALAGGYVGRSMEGCGSTARQPASAATPSAYRAAAPRARAASTQIDGREQSRDVVACLGPDGTWRPDSSAPAQQAAQADLVVRAQQRLRQDGFYVRDNIDGQWGPATSAAVSNFQRANGLPSSGQLDLSTRAAMGLDAAPVAASPVVPTSNAGQVGAPSLQTTQVRQAQ